MAFTDLPLFNVLRENMSWLTSRQRVLAENVANADTPGYRARDIERPDFHAMLRGETHMRSSGLLHSDRRHMLPTESASARGFRVTDSPDTASTPNGNTVVLEDQMMRVAETQMNHQAAVSLYQKSLGILRMAIRGAR